MPKKHTLDCPNDLWKEVLKFKIDCDFINNNNALLALISKGLAAYFAISKSQSQTQRDLNLNLNLNLKKRQEKKIKPVVAVAAAASSPPPSPPPPPISPILSSVKAKEKEKEKAKTKEKNIQEKYDILLKAISLVSKTGKIRDGVLMIAELDINKQIPERMKKRDSVFLKDILNMIKREKLKPPAEHVRVLMAIAEKTIYSDEKAKLDILFLREKYGE